MTMKPNAIERTVQKTSVWLHDVSNGLQIRDERIAYHALRAVLHALRDRMSVEDAAAVGAQLPLLVRGIYYEGWHPHGKPVRVRRADEFLDLVAANLSQDGEREIEPGRALDAVFGTLQLHADPGAVDKVLRALPPDIQSLLAPRIAARIELHDEKL
jgi:uncharacterized protein (DUF2267 family)